MLIMILGLLGTMLCVGAYGLLTFERLTPNSLVFHGMNLVGAAMLLISIAYEFDWGDFGGVLVAICWVLISLFGIARIVSSVSKGKVISDE